VQVALLGQATPTPKKLVYFFFFPFFLIEP